MWLWGKGFIVTGAREPPNFLARTRKFIHQKGCMASLDMCALHVVIWNRGMQADAGNCTYESRWSLSAPWSGISHWDFTGVSVQLLSQAACVPWKGWHSFWKQISSLVNCFKCSTMARNCGLWEDVAQDNWEGAKYVEIAFRGRMSGSECSLEEKKVKDSLR